MGPYRFSSVVLQKENLLYPWRSNRYDNMGVCVHSGAAKQLATALSRLHKWRDVVSL